MRPENSFDTIAQTAKQRNGSGRFAEARPPRPHRFGSGQDAGSGLAEQLFQGPERCGWEYIEPDPIRAYPYPEPQWQEPPPPDVSGPRRRQAKTRAALSRAGSAIAETLAGRLLVLISLPIIGVIIAEGVSRPEWGTPVLILLLAAFSAVPIYSLLQIWRIEQAARTAREAQWRDFLLAKARWDDETADHDAAEQRRVGTEPLLFPFALPEQSSRLDVVGGTPAGWASLLATMGGSLLASGSSVTVLDLSSYNVTASLAELAETVQVDVGVLDMPVDLEAAGLLGGLDPEDLANVLADAMDSLRGRNEQADLRAMDAELLLTVAKRLAHPLNFARLAAGVRVMRSTYDPDDAGPLSPAEVQILTEQIDLVDKSERVRDELRSVGNQLDLIATEQSRYQKITTDATIAQLWTAGGLSMIRSSGRSDRAKEFVDAVLFQAVAHNIAAGGTPVDNPVLVVVGADGLGRTALESMVRNAWRAQVRLVYVFKRLREDAADLLGGGDSVAMLMQLGNQQEAETAARHIGRGFSFQLSQVARQLGRTVTTGENESVTSQVGGAETRTESESESVTSGKSASRSLSDSFSRALTDSWSRSTTTGSMKSEADSVNDGQTYQRSYEFIVEPHQIQHLEQTAFVLVYTGPEGRRVTMGDCFPGLALVDRVSNTPRAVDENGRSPA